MRYPLVCLGSMLLAAGALASTQHAVLARAAPHVIAAAAAQGEGRRPLAAPASGALTSSAASATGNARELAAQIEGFGFDTCTAVGVGGMLLVSACPVVLFRSGEAPKKVSGLAHPQGVAAHEAANANDWTRWRKSGGRVQLQAKGSWKNLTYTAVYPTLPANFRLDGAFRSMGGAGTRAMGGAQSVAAWTDLRFFQDGRVERGGGAGASDGTSVVASSRTPVQTGRYHIEGLTLALRWDDGTSERRLLITNPADAKSAIWLDGQGYARKR